MVVLLVSNFSGQETTAITALTLDLKLWQGNNQTTEHVQINGK